MKVLMNLLLACFLLTSQLSAQQLRGRVIDQASQPVPYANVVLTRSDSTYVAGCVSNEAGEFQLVLASEAALLRVSYIGYREKVLPLPENRTDMGDIVLDEDALVLQEVVVKASIPVTRIKGDALETTVSGSVLEKVGTANDVLSKLPGVSLENGRLDVFGRGEPLIYINGREVRDADELAQLTSAEIEAVEVVSNPGARYAKSVKAVIRIRTKRRTDDGLGVSERTYVSYADQWGGSQQLNLYYRHGGLDVSGMVAYSDGYFRRLGDLTIDTYLADHWKNRAVTAETDRSRRLTTNLSVDYALGDKQSVGGNYRFFRDPNSRHGQDFTSDLLKNDEPYESVVSRMDNLKQTSNHEANIYYYAKWGDWDVRLDASLLRRKQKLNDATSQVETSEEGEARPSEVHTYNNTANTLYAGKLVVSRPLWEGDLTFGGEYSYTSRDNTYVNPENVIPNNLSWVQERLAAGFVEYERTLLKNVRLRAGLRFEDTGFGYYEDGKFQPGQSRHYSNLFPSVSLGFPIGPVQAQLAYSSDVTRPSYDMLNDRVAYITRYTYVQGNPFLRPQTVQSLTLKATYRWWQLYAALNHSKDEFSMYMDIYNDDPTISVQTYVNSPSYNWFRVSLTASPTIGCWSPRWEARLYKQWYSVDTPNDAGEVVTRRLNRWQPRLRWDNAFRLPAGFVLNADLGWVGKMDDGNSQSLRAYWNASASLYKGFFDDRLTFLLKGDALLDSYKNHYRGYSGTISVTDTRNRFNSRTVSLTVQYKFNQKKSKYKGTGAGDAQKFRL
ncbi:MAG: TonB-dependent receptor [Mediterranea sp.]|nr:TonB-dependent receptor [Mediterranea sp.]